MRKAQIFGAEITRNPPEGMVTIAILYGDPENPFDFDLPCKRERKVEKSSVMNFLNRLATMLDEPLIGEGKKDNIRFWPLSKFSSTTIPSEIILYANGKFSDKFKMWRENFLK